MTHPWATLGSGKGAEYQYFDKEADIGAEWGHNLPHWRQGGVIYFVTFRTADSMPADRIALWMSEREVWLANHPALRSSTMTKEYHRIFAQRWHEWLDESLGACELKEPNLRQIVEATLRRLDGNTDGYALVEYVIMPNHVHALVSPAPGQSLSKILRAWKSVSAHRINDAQDNRGSFWQEESWDHIVRSPIHLEKYRKYIRENPDALPKVGRQPSANHS